MRRAFTLIEFLAIGTHALERYEQPFCRRACVGMAMLFLSGCGSPGRGLADPDASYKIPAIHDAVNDKDRAAEPQLVQALSNDDPAVRFYAAEGLRRLTGDSFGYRYYDNVVDRQPAIDRWKAWLAKQKQ